MLFVSHLPIRNIWDRAVQLLPRVHQFWYKYILMEYRLNNYAAVRYHALLPPSAPT